MKAILTSSSPLALLLWLQASIFAQSPLEFEVATIKLAAPDAIRGRLAPAGPDRLSIPAMTVRGLIYTAYQQGMGTSWSVRGGPAWIDETLYAIEGQAAQPATQRELRIMLRTLLAQRFRLKIRQETQAGALGTGGIFTLVLDREDGRFGPNLQKWDGTCGGRPPSDLLDADDPYIPRCPSGYFPRGIMLEGGTMFSAAELLSLPRSRALLGKFVQDKTGLEGRYKMFLDYDFAPVRPADPAGQPEFAGPSLFQAVREQWGLRLEKGEGTLNVVIVEGVERPTEN